MDTTFKLDTSGVVHTQVDFRGGTSFFWSNLDPFMQGYIAALFASHIKSNAPPFRALGFSDLAPETMARIMEDCARKCSGSSNARHWRGSEKFGREFWSDRQAGDVKRFPPLTVYLGDDSKVRFQ